MIPDPHPDDLHDDPHHDLHHGASREGGGPDGDGTVLPIDEASAERLAALRGDLARRAAADGLLDLAHRVVDTPIGPCLVVLAPTGIVRIAFEIEDHDAVLAGLATLISPRILADSDRTDPAARQLDEYFAGTRHRFELPVDLRLAHGFRRTVLDAMRLVPYGETVSYARLAEAAGNPKAVRAAGSACASNPVPIVVPCHRIVRSDGTTGNYRGGPEAKVTLLALERAGA